uniref:Uncharacterized protein n=1 Tax=Anguilla anguilla TaxID=7936 RepID=A0A0E9WCC2_ANGAN
MKYKVKMKCKASSEILWLPFRHGVVHIHVRTSVREGGDIFRGWLL